MRWLLVEAAWCVLRSTSDETAALRGWASGIAARRGKRIAAVALARRLAGILFALWRDGTAYDATKIRGLARWPSLPGGSRPAPPLPRVTLHSRRETPLGDQRSRLTNDSTRLGQAEGGLTLARTPWSTRAPGTPRGLERTETGAASATNSLTQHVRRRSRGIVGAVRLLSHHPTAPGPLRPISEREQKDDQHLETACGQTDTGGIRHARAQQAAHGGGLRMPFNARATRTASSRPQQTPRNGT